MPEDLSIVHATALAAHGMGCVLLGRSGVGKTRLAAEAMALGARLIADDQVVLEPVAGQLIASAPTSLAGIMEIRGLGLVRVADALMRHPVHLAVTLQPELPEDRLPEPSWVTFGGVRLPHYLLPSPPHGSAAMLLLFLQAMQEGRILPPNWHPSDR